MSGVKPLLCMFSRQGKESRSRLDPFRATSEWEGDKSIFASERKSGNRKSGKAETPRQGGKKEQKQTKGNEGGLGSYAGYCPPTPQWLGRFWKS